MQPGDLVMSTAGYVKHPTVGCQSIYTSYIVVGVEESFTYARWCALKVKSEWIHYDNDHERVVVQWMTVDATLTGQRYVYSNHPYPPKLFCNSELVHFYVEIPPTHVSNLKVLCTKNLCKLAGLNAYLVEVITASFVYHVDLGW